MYPSPVLVMKMKANIVFMNFQAQMMKAEKLKACGRKITRNKLVGVLIGIAGTTILIGPDALKGITGSLLRQLAVLTAAISYAFAILISSILLGVVFLGETFTPLQAIGMALIGAGLIVMDGRLLKRR